MITPQTLEILPSFLLVPKEEKKDWLSFHQDSKGQYQEKVHQPNLKDPLQYLLRREPNCYYIIQEGIVYYWMIEVNHTIKSTRFYKVIKNEEGKFDKEFLFLRQGSIRLLLAFDNTYVIQEGIRYSVLVKTQEIVIETHHRSLPIMVNANPFENKIYILTSKFSLAVFAIKDQKFQKEKEYELEVPIPRSVDNPNFFTINNEFILFSYPTLYFFDLSQEGKLLQKIKIGNGFMNPVITAVTINQFSVQLSNEIYIYRKSSHHENKWRLSSILRVEDSFKYQLIKLPLSRTELVKSVSLIKWVDLPLDLLIEVVEFCVDRTYD